MRIDFTEEISRLVLKVEEASIRLGDLTHVNYGAQMSSKDKGAFGKEHVLRDAKTTQTCVKTIGGRDLYRYSAMWSGKYVEWALAPQMYGSRDKWFFESPKLMIRDITGTHRIEAALDRTKLYCDHTILCALRLIDVPANKASAAADVQLSGRYSLEFLQAAVASKVVSAYYYWVLTGEGVRTGGGFHTYPSTIRALRVPSTAVLDQPNNRVIVQEIEKLAERLAETAAKLKSESSPHRIEQLTQRLEADDARVDALFFQLYGLSVGEIALIQSALETNSQEVVATEGADELVE